MAGIPRELQVKERKKRKEQIVRETTEKARLINTDRVT